MNDNLSILFISRASLFTVKGGDTVQIIKTAAALRRAGLSIDIKLCNEKNIDYRCYDLIHFFNIRHPADILLHIKKSNLPYVISTIYVDYANPVIQKTKGIRNHILNLFTSDAQEYIKTIGKAILQNEKIISRSYIWNGHKKSVRRVLKDAAGLLPNSENEYQRLLTSYGIEKKYRVIPNGADTDIFHCCREDIVNKDASMVLCVARIELRKNQINLIRALNDTSFQLYLIGDPAPNHKAYYNECKRISKSNVHFLEAVPQENLVQYYRKAKVHILPSWFETTGLSSLEALYCGCNVVVTKYGDTSDYFDPQYCFFCDPGSIDSIREAVVKASESETKINYIDAVRSKYNWQQAAEKTLMAYMQAIGNKQ